MTRPSGGVHYPADGLPCWCPAGPLVVRDGEARHSRLCLMLRNLDREAVERGETEFWAGTSVEERGRPSLLMRGFDSRPAHP